MKILLDTDILSAIMKQRPAALSSARQYLTQYGQFSFSIVTVYEILRGLKAKNAQTQIANFRLFYQRCEILAISRISGLMIANWLKTKA